MSEQIPSLSEWRARRLRTIGVVVLMLGIVSAGIVYWLGTRSPDLNDDASMAGYSKPETQQMERLYGKWGDLTDDLLDDLKQPGTQAFIIVVAAALVAGGCFYFARLSDDDGEIH
jgi:hypothetical protein